MSGVTWSSGGRSVGRRRGLRGLGVAIFIALGVPASAGAATTTFGFTGAEQVFTVPAGVSSVHVDAIGAPGASTSQVTGGRGAQVVGDLPVVAGQTLFVEVGGKGNGINDAPSGAGGFNGGATGGRRANSTTQHDPGGGGASDVRTVSASQGNSLGSRLLIAAGGGGAGEFYGVNQGGDAGSPGGDGTKGPGGAPYGRGGGAGTAGGGGSGGLGAGGGPGASGGLGVGGHGGDSAAFAGGGGGGGLYGGGGGGGSDMSGGSGGGGGGSSFTDASVSSASTTIDVSGTPSITISFQDPGGGGGGGGGDTTLPAFLGSAKADPSTFAVDPKGTREKAVKSAAKKKPKKGTTFRYTLSEPARVVFTIERKGKGRKVGTKCKKQTNSNRKNKRCTRYKRIGAFAQQGVAGKNKKRFSGWIGKKKLSPAKYRASLVATDAAGNKSPAKLIAFKIVRP